MAGRSTVDVVIDDRVKEIERKEKMSHLEQLNRLLQEISDKTPTSKYTVQVVFGVVVVKTYSTPTRFLANLIKKYLEHRKPGVKVFIWKNY